MNDIENRSDLVLLMEAFYEKLLADDTVSFIFTDVAQIDLPSHLPHIVDFWEHNILNTGSYRNNIFQVHQQLNQKHRLTPQHFSTWLSHFEKTVDECFVGPNAEKIKIRALSIATIMQIKL